MIDIFWCMKNTIMLNCMTVLDESYDLVLISFVHIFIGSKSHFNLIVRCIVGDAMVESGRQWNIGHSSIILELIY